METITLNKEEFKKFNQYDQFGFFYDEDGFPAADANSKFDQNVDALYMQYNYIEVDGRDNIYGITSGHQELIMEGVIEAYEIAKEVKEL